MDSLLSLARQSFFLGNPKYTGVDLPDLNDKVVIVTGSNTGIGKETAQLLYAKNAKVYMMARSEEKTTQAIADIKAAVPESQGQLIFIRLDLADLPTVKASAAEFLRQESRLDVLVNNAGVGYPERGSRTKQGYELQLGVNCVGTFLFTRLLTPALVATAGKEASSGAVRVVWVSSSAAEGASPGTMMADLERIERASPMTQYCISKFGNFLHSAEFARRHTSADGIVSVSLNPGNLHSDFFRTQGRLVLWLIRTLLLYPTIFGAYTELFAGFSSDVTTERSGSHIAPWGRFWNVSKGMVAATKTEAEGGTGVAGQFWEWSEAQVKQYL